MKYHIYITRSIGQRRTRSASLKVDFYISKFITTRFIMLLNIFKCDIFVDAISKKLSSYLAENTLCLISFTNFNAQFLYSLTICMLHYNPRHVSRINMPIFRRKNYIITASGIVTLCKRLYNMPDESRLQSSLLSSGNYVYRLYS